MEEKLSALNDIEEIRYIVLTHKEDLITYNGYLSPKTCVISQFCSKKSNNIRSKLVYSSCRKHLVVMAKYLLHQLICNKPDSLFGISIVVDTPECNGVMLNATRNAVLHQYYGLDIRSIDSDIVERVAFRSDISITSECSDPNKLIIKPFPSKMMYMSDILHSILLKNVSLLSLDSVDLSNSFNTCTVLLYYTLPGVKNKSGMGWHCDSKYSLSGKFKQSANGQTENTAVVIFTIGK